MSDRFALRAANSADFAFCQRLYFGSMGWIIEALNLGFERQQDGLARQWRVQEVRIITVAGEDAGWLQTAPADGAIFLGQLYLMDRFQRQGIGTDVIKLVIEAAAREGKAVTLGVVKISPARRLYERLGFIVTREDQHKVYMRREPDLLVT
jgi:GNAT superfamily N-acetyltransferase